MSRPQVEPMGWGDLAAVLAIARGSFSEPWGLAAVVDEFRLEHSKRLIIRSGGGAVGGYCVGWRVADELDVLSIAVAPRLRRQGLGKILMSTVIALAVSESLAAVTLEVRRGSTSALALYSSLGFRQSGVRPRYYYGGEDALLLRLDLPGTG